MKTFKTPKLVAMAIALAAVLAACSSAPAAPLESYRAGSGNTLVVTAILGVGDTVAEARVVEETAQRVTVAVTITSETDERSSVGVPTNVELQLSEPLGGRAVYAEGSNTPLPQATAVTPAS